MPKVNGVAAWLGRPTYKQPSRYRVHCSNGYQDDAGGMLAYSLLYEWF